MKSRTQIVKTALYVVAAIALVAIVAIRLMKNKEVVQEKVYQFDPAKAVLVQADTLRIRALSDERGFTGTFEPNKETKLSAEVQGGIKSIHADVGQLVRKGQILIQLDTALLGLQVKSLEVQIEGHETDVTRLTVLTQADAVQGVQLEKASLALRAAKAQKATLKEQINKATIRAPFDGIITAKLNEVGGFAAPGMPLMQLTDIHELKFTINVPEKDLQMFKVGQGYAVHADALSDATLKGRLTLIGSKANIGNSFQVQFQVANTPGLDIKSGMFGKVALSGSGSEKGLLVPNSATFQSNGKTLVYLARNGKAASVPVVLGRNLGDASVVKDGLAEGDVLITNGFVNLHDGANILLK